MDIFLYILSIIATIIEAANVNYIIFPFCYQLYQLIHVTPIPVESMLIVKSRITEHSVLASLDTLVTQMWSADLSASSILTAPDTWHVLIRNVLTHAQAPVASMHSVMLSTIMPCAAVHVVTTAIHMSSAELVSTLLECVWEWLLDYLVFSVCSIRFHLFVMYIPIARLPNCGNCISMR